MENVWWSLPLPLFYSMLKQLCMPICPKIFLICVIILTHKINALTFIMINTFAQTWLMISLVEKSIALSIKICTFYLANFPFFLQQIPNVFCYLCQRSFSKFVFQMVALCICNGIIGILVQYFALQANTFFRNRYFNVFVLLIPIV